MKTTVMELQFDGITLDNAVQRAMKAVEQGQSMRIVTPNAEFGMTAAKDSEFCKLLNDSDMVLPDGIGVVIASKIVGSKLPGRVAGIDFADALCAKLAHSGDGLYLLGAKPGVAQMAAENLQKKHVGLKISGTHDGYFNDEKAVVAEIKNSGAKVLFVCLGAPRQELFMQANAHTLAPIVQAGLGGSLDVFAGNVKRAPDIFIKLGMEWFYRICKQPSRAKRAVKLPLYLLHAVSFRIKNGKTV